ncbi:MAG: tetratricopeptide repeat protein [Campylobacterales bacterium]
MFRIFLFLIIGIVIGSLFFRTPSFKEGIEALEKKDYKKAEEVFFYYCNNGEGTGCFNLGVLYYRLGNKPLSLGYYQKSCDFKFPQGCIVTGYFFLIGDEVSKDLDKAKSYFQKACKLGEEKGCQLAKEVDTKKTINFVGGLIDLIPGVKLIVKGVRFIKEGARFIKNLVK